MTTRKIIRRTGPTLIAAMLVLGAASLPVVADERPGEENTPTQQQTMMQPEARDAFLADTVELRRDMAVKRATMRALMQQDNPDTEAIARLAAELFDLREQLRGRAREAGLPPRGTMFAARGGHPCGNRVPGPGGGMSHHMGPSW